MKYEVNSSRYDIARHCIASFEALTDQEAIEKFYLEYAGNPDYAWDWLELIEVVQERIERTVKTKKNK